MTDQTAKVRAFKDLHISGNPLILFNAWDAGSTKAVEKAGARAIATGSWSVAAANGYGDGEKVPLDLAMEILARIVAATDLPVSVDIESGYGDAPEAVGRTVQKAVAAGAIGCNLEDSFPADGSLRDAEAQVLRIRAARQAANALPFFINARTDVFFQKPAPQHDDAMLEDAVRRGQRGRPGRRHGHPPVLRDVFRAEPRARARRRRRGPDHGVLRTDAARRPQARRRVPDASL